MGRTNAEYKELQPLAQQRIPGVNVIIDESVVYGDEKLEKRYRDIFGEGKALQKHVFGNMSGF